MSEPKIGDVVWWYGGVGVVLDVDRYRVTLNNGEIVSKRADMMHVATEVQRQQFKEQKMAALAQTASEEFLALK